jgi:hypothetical protein
MPIKELSFAADVFGMTTTSLPDSWHNFKFKNWKKVINLVQKGKIFDLGVNLSLDFLT